MQPGTRIGHYEVLKPVGRGGMGEVWKARDTKLGREVAIKTLPAGLAQEPERLARLVREAELLATLNHPHIATIHAFEQLDGASFLVLELVEGETLDGRLLGGAMPIEEALTLALQIAQGLEAAHVRGIIHRDLKPSNIKVTPDGRIKVLDFGIAKALAAADGDDTQTVDPTRVGAVIGTPAYMSPEQARGEAVGFQSDIWSFGAVLYEMLTGISPFKRKTSADTLASVLQAPPDYAALSSNIPVLARRVVQRCLERDLSRRLHHMGDVRILVEEALGSLGSQPLVDSRATVRHRAWLLAAGIAAAALAGVAGGLLVNRPAPAESAAPVHAAMPFVGRPAAFPYGSRHLAIASNGSSVAFVSSTGVQIRRIDQEEPVTIQTGWASNPFFSPDGDWIGLFLDTSLVKVPVKGGPPVTLTTLTDRPAGGAWRADGTIVFATSDALYQVPANGGERKAIATPDRGQKELQYGWPQFLPGGQSILLTVVPEDTNEAPQIVLLDLRTLERRLLLRGSSASYVPSGHLVYVSGTTLNVVAFDALTGTLTGRPIAFPEIKVAVAQDNGAANFAVSATGTLIFTSSSSRTLSALEWINRSGQQESLGVEPQAYGYAMVSPDGTRVAVERFTNGNRDIWILDLKRLTQTQLTDGPTEDMLPVWSADSRRVYFASSRGGNFDVYSQAADGASSARLEFAGPEFQSPSATTPDGTRLIVYDRFNDLRILDFARPDRLEPLLHSGFDERLGQLSPDGRWIAYESNESGSRFEIVLRSFPNVHERREMISVNGGRFPRWGPRGSDELYYVTPEGAMMAASVRLSAALTLGAPKKLFDWQAPPASRSGLQYDVAPDGRFLVKRALASSQDASTNVSLVLNWLSGLRDDGR